MRGRGPLAWERLEKCREKYLKIHINGSYRLSRISFQQAAYPKVSLARLVL